MKRVYCVIDTSGEIVGRFTDKKRANDYAIDYYFNSYDDAKLPEWVGEITTNEAGKKALPTSSIEKVEVNGILES